MREGDSSLAGEERRQENAECVQRPAGHAPPSSTVQCESESSSLTGSAAHDGDSCDRGQRGRPSALVQGHAMVLDEAMGTGGGGACAVVRRGFVGARHHWG